MSHGRFVGIPYAEHGHDWSGVRCWGLVALFYRQEFGLDLPLYETTPTADNALCAETITSNAEASWVEVPEGKHRYGDVAVIERVVRRRVLPCHVGVWVSKDRILHVDEGRSSVVVPYPGPQLVGRVARTYRHPALA